ncbi:MAG: BCAM0308 family protein [Betaproteobacteria bacterium]|nr:BCAM0308 family protein [Betaproteobacteria bacterium]
MKAGRQGFRMLRREQLLPELVHDSYRSRRKLSDMTRCPDCGAVYIDGRWTWQGAPADTAEERCPACHRVRDRFPAGFVSIGGKFFSSHREEILGRVANCEREAKHDRPVERIMAIEDAEGGVLVTTTDPHLARRIGEALYDAYKGDLAYHYNKQDNLLRVAWQR